MSSHLGPMYHWSPRSRLKGIKRLGLVPGKRNVNGPTFHDPDDPSRGEFTQPGVCLSPDPATAWAYSHGCWRSNGIFDLWQLSLATSDEVHVLSQWGSRILEVRVHNRIPKGRLVWVGERTVE